MLATALARRFRGTSESGQASVELLGAIPAVLLVGALVWQLALTGHTLGLCANAARAGARAEAVGRSGKSAARSALPRSLERGFEFKRETSGRVRVRIRVPLVLRRWRSPVSVSASAALVEAR